jgi:hypothetical protein
LKPERWGSLLVQENNQEEKAHDKRRIIIMIIITSLGVKRPGYGCDLLSPFSAEVDYE